MFGSDVDYFGTHKIRRKMALDLDKRKRIADTKAALESMGREFDVKTIFLSKEVLFSKLIARRHTDQSALVDPLDLARGRAPRKQDPLVAAAVYIVECDRLETLPTLLKSMTRHQMQAVEEALEARSQRIHAAQEPVVEAVDVGDEAPDEPNDEARADEAVE